MHPFGDQGRPEDLPVPHRTILELVRKWAHCAAFGQDGWELSPTFAFWVVEYIYIYNICINKYIYIYRLSGQFTVSLPFGVFSNGEI